MLNGSLWLDNIPYIYFDSPYCDLYYDYSQYVIPYIGI